MLTYFVKRNDDSNFEGMFSHADLLEGLTSGKLNPDWLAAENVDGSSYAQFVKAGGGEWRSLSALAGDTPEALQQAREKHVQQQASRAPAVSRVHIADIDMPFWSMVGFMIKWSVAAVPAIIIVAIIWTVGGALFTGVVTGLSAGAR
jgi:hypothetical protein